MTRATRCSRPGSGLAVLALAVSVPLLCATAAAADLLVTRDGSVIETRGAWKVEGRLVLFQLPNGQLASMKLAEVDLEASRAAMEKRRAAARKRPPAKPPERTAVLVLTDDDVSKARSSGGDEAAAVEADAAGQLADQAAAAERLVVSSWEEDSTDDGVVITGQLFNQSADIATNIQLAVLFYDREQELVQSTLADVTSPVLQPGQRARFRADAEGVFTYSSVGFEATSLGLVRGAEREGDDAEGAGIEGLEGQDLEGESPEGEGPGDSEATAGEG